jgi:hypothetical protein
MKIQRGFLILLSAVILVGFRISSPSQRIPGTVYGASKRPSDKDSDKDCLTDADEKKRFKTNPKRKDSDVDGILDGDEDQNNNSVPNEDEDDRSSKAKKRKCNLDSDRDGLQNEDEDDWGTKANDSDSDNDGVVDGNEDTDGDGKANEDEDDRRRERGSKEDQDDKGSTGGDDGTARPTPTRPPTPRPTSPSGNFDSNGNVTSVGKQLFGIPSSLSGNISRGNSVFQANCAGCHEQRVNRTYSSYRAAISRSPMNISLTDTDLAHLTAYLNRFRP